MTLQTPTAYKPDRRKQTRHIVTQPRDYGWTLFLIVITLLMVAGFFISNDGWYKAGDETGYNLGLAGGIMMSTILLYPLRKRMAFMKSWVILPRWFQWHMVCGVLGPAIIMFHSAFKVYIPVLHPSGSINAAVATLSMLLVSGSGIFGRFFYSKIHYGLYGRHATLKELQEELEGSGDIKSIFSFAPEIQRKLIEFGKYALNTPQAGGLKMLDFVKAGVRAKMLTRELARELEEIMYADVQEKQWNNAQMKRLDEMYFQNERFIRDYLVNVRDVAQIGTYEGLFSLWHLFHVPFVFMLVFSGIWHVIAVHMY